MFIAFHSMLSHDALPPAIFRRRDAVFMLTPLPIFILMLYAFYA